MHIHQLFSGISVKCTASLKTCLVTKFRKPTGMEKTEPVPYPYMNWHPQITWGIFIGLDEQMTTGNTFSGCDLHVTALAVLSQQHCVSNSSPECSNMEFVRGLLLFLTQLTLYVAALEIQDGLPVASTADGLLRGTASKSRDGRDFYSFKGVKYGEANRFEVEQKTLE